MFPGSDPAAAKSTRDQGIAAYRAGDRVRARDLLRQSAQLNPNDEHTWLWLAGAVDSDLERREALGRALEINPGNEAARRELERLGVSFTAPPAAQPQQPFPGGYSSAGAQTVPLQTAQPAYAGAGGAYQPVVQPPPQHPGAAPMVGYPSDVYVPNIGRGPRPFGIGCLAVLSILGGVLMILAVLLVMFALSDPEVRAELGQFVGPLLLLGGIFAVFIAVMAVLSLAGGVGLWVGARWAWWLSVVTYGYSITAAPLTLLMNVSQGSDTNTPAEALGSTLGSMLLYGLIFAYLFKGNVLSFFGIAPEKRTTNIAISLGIGFILAALFRALVLAIA